MKKITYSKGGKNRKTTKLIKKAIFYMARNGEFDKIIKYEENPFERRRVRRYKEAIEYAIRQGWDRQGISYIPLVREAPASVLRDVLAVMVCIEDKEERDQEQ